MTLEQRIAALRTENEKGGLVSKWSYPSLGHFAYKGIPTWTEMETLAYCCEVAWNSKFGIECGTYMGASLFCMAKAAPHCHIWAIDRWDVFGTKEITEMFCDEFISKGQVELIVGDSARGAEMLQHMKDKLDFAWCDDGHAEEDLRRDISCFLPLLRPGGILFGHDWDGDNDVARGVKSMIPLEKLTWPVPRVWQYIKP